MNHTTPIIIAKDSVKKINNESCIYLLLQRSSDAHLICASHNIWLIGRYFCGANLHRGNPALITKVSGCGLNAVFDYALGLLQLATAQARGTYDW